MNRRLQDPFQSVGLPEVIEEYLQHGDARCLAFNRHGSLLASGTKGGEVVIWDYDTRGVAKVLKRHNSAVMSLSWSRNGQQLASGSADGTVCLWNVLEGAVASEVKLAGNVQHVSLSPRAPYRCASSMSTGLPQLIDFATGKASPLSAAVEAQPEASGRGRNDTSGAAAPSSLALFSKAGDAIFVAQARGTLAVLDAKSLQVMDLLRIAGSPKILSMCLSRKGRHLLLNCHDRVVRMFEVSLPQPPAQRQTFLAGQVAQALADAGEVGAKGVSKGRSLLLPKESAVLQPQREFQNAVERTQWKCVCLSHDTEHVVAATLRKDEHQLYIWNSVLGQLVYILEGPREAIHTMAWHPSRSILAALSSTGRIYLWAKIYDENWSAFAPDFQVTITALRLPGCVAGKMQRANEKEAYWKILCRRGLGPLLPAFDNHTLCGCLLYLLHKLRNKLFVCF